MPGLRATDLVTEAVLLAGIRTPLVSWFHVSWQLTDRNQVLPGNGCGASSGSGDCRSAHTRSALAGLRTEVPT